MEEIIKLKAQVFDILAEIDILNLKINRLSERKSSLVNQIVELQKKLNDSGNSNT